MKKIALWAAKCAAAVTFLSAFFMAGWPCGFMSHQPVEPDEVKALRRF